MQVLKFTSRRATNIKKMGGHTTPYFTRVYVTFLNSKSFFKASGRLNILLNTTFRGYQINNISTATPKNSLNFIFPLGSKASKVRGNYEIFLADVTFFAAFFFITFILFGSPNKIMMVIRFLLDSYSFVCYTYGIMR